MACDTRRLLFAESQVSHASAINIIANYEDGKEIKMWGKVKGARMEGGVIKEQLAGTAMRSYQQPAVMQSL